MPFNAQASRARQVPLSCRRWLVIALCIIVALATASIGGIHFDQGHFTKGAGAILVAAGWVVAAVEWYRSIATIAILASAMPLAMMCPVIVSLK